MKNIFLVFAVVMSLGISAHAAVNEAGDMGTVVCNQNTRYSPDLSSGRNTVVLKQLEGYNYALTYSKKLPHAERTVILETVVRVYQSDVVVTFRSINDRVSFRIYLDELDQSSLHFRGQDVNFTCKFLQGIK